MLDGDGSCCDNCKWDHESLDGPHCSGCEVDNAAYLNWEPVVDQDPTISSYSFVKDMKSEVFMENQDNFGIVTRPLHYTVYPIEPITFIMRNKLPFWLGNVIKYTCRAGLKVYDGMDEVASEITDLKKAKRYIEMRINQLNGEVEL